MILESGPAPGLRNYNRNTLLGLLLACGLFAYWFYRDGTTGYIAQNREEAQKALTPLMDASAIPTEFGPLPDKEAYEQVRKAAPKSIDEVYQALGKPQHSTVRGLSQIDLFVSDYGMASIQSSRGVVDWQQSTWKDWHHSKDDIQVQFMMMWACVLAAAACLYGIYGTSSLRVRIDDDGMTYGGRQIPFAEMKELKDYSRKGWVDLYYGPGTPRKLRIDNMKVDKFDEIINVICEKKGFADPRPAPVTETEADSADE